MDVPAALRRLVAIHGALDLLLALPLLLFPQRFLGAFGWSCVDTATARLLGAAFLAIGLRSLAAQRDPSVEAFGAILDLRIVFGLGGTVALALAFGDEKTPPAATLPLAYLIGFSGVFIYYRLRMKQLAAITDDPGDDPAFAGEDPAEELADEEDDGGRPN